MGKDREGRFHPRKGKPSGSMSEASGLKPITTSSLEEQMEIAEKYTVGDEEPAPNVRVRHRNRNVDKREQKQQDRSQMQNNRTKREMFTAERTNTRPAILLDVLTRETFQYLAEYTSSCCVTMYLPTHPGGMEVNERVDATAFKNKLQQITALLREKGHDQTFIEDLLKPGYDLYRDDELWYNLSPGLAVFISEGVFRYMKMPYSPTEKLLINTSFYVTPLLPVMMNVDSFYLLVLSYKQARLYRADAFGMAHVPVEGLPRGVDDVVRLEEKDGKQLWRTGSSGAGGGANFHGTGEGRPDKKENLAMYFDEVDETLAATVLNQETAPLLLAGVDYLIPIYRSVAKYKPIWDEAITGNVENEDMDTLYRLAREKMEPHFDERHRKALEMYHNHSVTPMTSSVPADVIPAAHYARVWHLFVTKDEHIWGRFDEMDNKLVIHEEQEEGDECLIDKAVIRTILNGGEVHILPQERMPAKSKIAALMRYASS